MIKNMRAGLLAAALTAIFAAAVLGASLGGTAFAAASESEYYLEAEEPSGYYNGVDGCVYRVPVGSNAYGGFVKAVYDVVRLKGDIGETVELNELNELVSDHEYISENNVITKSELTPYGSQTPSRHSYFTVTAYEWCAFVFTVYYSGNNGEETPAYGSKVLYCRSIDNSTPEAYYDNWVFEAGKYVFDVVVRGNRRNASRSANSGLKAFTVYKYAGGVRTDLDEVTNIGSNVYNYKLKVGREKASYYFDIIDNAGNGTKAMKIVEFTQASYDPGFESAVENQLSALANEALYADFAPALAARLNAAYYDYYLLIQDSGSSEAEIKAARAAVDVILKYVAELRAMKAAGEKEYAVQNLNTEYFGGDITLVNAGRAYGGQLYGEKAYYTLSVAQFDPDRADRKDAMKFAGISKAERLYTVRLGLKNGENEVNAEFDEPLILRLPVELNGAAAVQTVYLDGVKTFAVCGIVEGNGYTDIAVPYSYGAVDIFAGSGSKTVYLWFLTVIPVAAAAVVVPLVLKKKRADARKETAEE